MSLRPFWLPGRSAPFARSACVGGRGRRLWWAAAALLSLVAATFIVLPATPASTLVLYDGTVLAAGLAVIVGARRAGGSRGRSWLWIAAALLLWWAGEITWWTLERLGQDPFPSIADLFYLAGYPALAWGLVRIVWSRETLADRGAILDGAIVSLVAALLFWIFLIAPAVTDSTFSVIERLVAGAYPAADVLLLVLVARLLMGAGIHHPGHRLLLGAIGVTLAADLLFGLAVLREIYAEGGLVDAVYLAGYVLFALAGLHPRLIDVAQAVPPPVLTLRSLRMGVLGAAVLIPPLTLAFPDYFLGEVEGGHLAASLVTLLVFGLAMARLWGLTRLVRRLTEQRGQTRFEAIIEHASDVTAIVDPAGRVAWISPSVRRHWGYAAEAVRGAEIAAFAPEPDRGRIRMVLRGAGAAPSQDPRTFAFALQLADGRMHEIEARAANLLTHPDVQGLAVTFRDVTEQKELERQLTHQAFHDSLTGLANRALFMDRLGHALRRHGKQSANHVSTLFIDLDNFKAVNDGLGHDVGDTLLNAVGARLAGCIRPGDTPARLGGDEFAILLEDGGDRDAAASLAGAILRALNAPFLIAGRTLPVSASIGVAVANTEATAERLLQGADLAMYAAKDGGKNRVAVYEPTMGSKATAEHELRNDLVHALARGQFRLDYQPIFSAVERRLVAAEALLRWDHPRRGTVSPLDFVPIAEETGLIVPIGRWVLHTACAAAARWQRVATAPVAVTVNVSAVQIRDAGLLADVRAALAQADLPPDRLILELTESQSLGDDPRTIEQLERLRALGVGVALDDFGTGYSALWYLRTLPVSHIKIDRGFIAALEGKPEAAALVRNVLELGRTLGKAVVAEGIESRAQFDQLRTLGCDLVQGFLFSPPAPEDALLLWFQAPEPALHVA